MLLFDRYQQYIKKKIDIATKAKAIADIFGNHKKEEWQDIESDTSSQDTTSQQAWDLDQAIVQKPVSINIDTDGDFADIYLKLWNVPWIKQVLVELRISPYDRQCSTDEIIFRPYQHTHNGEHLIDKQSVYYRPLDRRRITTTAVFTMLLWGICRHTDIWTSLSEAIVFLTSIRAFYGTRPNFEKRLVKNLKIGSYVFTPAYLSHIQWKIVENWRILRTRNQRFAASIVHPDAIRIEHTPEYAMLVMGFNQDDVTAVNRKPCKITTIRLLDEWDIKKLFDTCRVDMTLRFVLPEYTTLIRQTSVDLIQSLERVPWSDPKMVSVDPKGDIHTNEYTAVVSQELFGRFLSKWKEGEYQGCLFATPSWSS